MTGPELLMQRAKQERNDGDVAAAEASYAEAASLAQSEHLPNLRAHALRHVAELAADRGDGDRALGAAEEAVAIYTGDKGAQRLNLANARRVRALAFGSLGREDEAARDWRAARMIYEELGIEAGVAECDRRLNPV